MTRMEAVRFAGNALWQSCVVTVLSLAMSSCAAVKIAAIGQGALVVFSSTRIANYVYNGQPYQQPGLRDVSQRSEPDHLPVFMGAVEVNDAGYLADRRQVEAILHELPNLARRYNLSLVVYAHGWRHNSSENDPDVEHFRSTLRTLDQIVRRTPPTPSSVVENTHLPRVIVGIYLGWKGKTTFEWPDSWGHVKDLLSLHVYTTFWSRKVAADRAGQGDLRRFVVALAALHSDWADESTAYNSNSLNFIGHSFGGHLLLSALRDELEASLIAAESPLGAPAVVGMAATGPTSIALSSRLPSAMGNIILINPAVEEAQLRYIHDMNGRTTFAPGQPPLISVFSAENDRARSIMFPLGTKVANAGVHFGKGQRRLATTALGSGSEFITDTLRLTRTDRASLQWARQDVGPPDTVAARVTLKSHAAEAWVPQQVMDGNGRLRLFARDGNARASAAVIAKVKKDIIDDHSGFWREGFTEWLVSYVVALDQAQTRPRTGLSSSRTLEHSTTKTPLPDTSSSTKR